MQDMKQVAPAAQQASHAEAIVAALPRLRRFARTLTRNVHDADDLVQLAVERALGRIDQWRPESSLVNWLFGIVRNAWIDEARSRQRRGRLFTSDDAAAERVADPAAEQAVERLSLQDALERLPDDQRLAVALVLVEGLSYREAAEVMQVPVGTLTSRLARARQALVAELGAPTTPEAR
jgi:RNA polymerase sigma-70 factor, ECF subfamily